MASDGSTLSEVIEILERHSQDVIYDLIFNFSAFGTQVVLSKAQTYIRRNWQSKLLNKINRLITSFFDQSIKKRIDSLLDMWTHTLNMLAREDGLNHPPR